MNINSNSNEDEAHSGIYLFFPHKFPEILTFKLIYSCELIILVLKINKLPSASVS
jgi:hypothetical protein